MPNKIQYQLKKLPLISCALLSCLAFGQVHAVSNDQVKQLVESEKKNYLNTLEALVNIESGSKDLVGVNKIAKYVAEQLKTTGAEVSIVEPKDIYRMDDTPQQTGPMVKAVLKGKGSSKIMLIAHMDTVYLTGILKDQPFKMEGDKVFGLGILDNQFTHSFPPFPRPQSDILLHPPGRNHPDQRELSFPASVSAPGNRPPRRLRLQGSVAPPGSPRHCFSFQVPDFPAR